jgi:poly-D-alanine transfer protein DltD
MLNERLGRAAKGIDDVGVADFGSGRRAMNPKMQAMWQAEAFAIDSVALQSYRAIVAQLRTRGISVIFVVPPTADSLVQTRGVMLNAYYERMRTEFGADGLWIDFHSMQYDQFAKDTVNFTDGVHLTPRGAARLVTDANRQIGVWIDERRLLLKQGQR